MGRQLRLKGSPESAPPVANTETKTSATATSGTDNPGSNPANCDVSFDMFGFIRVLFLNRRWLVGAVLTAGVVTAIATLFIPNQYTAHASLLPSKSGGKLSALKGITGLAALDIAGGFGGSSESSSELFPTTLNSARLRNAILQKRYQFTADNKKYSLTMLEYLDETNLDKARKALAKITTVSSEFKTGVVTLDVTTKYPELSAQVAQAYIDELDTFNRTQRKTRATEYENFLHERLDVGKAEMASAEDALEKFQTVNRDWAFSNDPALQKKLLALKRDLEIKTKTFALLTQQYEIARSETRKDLPVVQALDAPVAPLVKSAPQRTLTVIFAMLIAAVFAVGILIVRESFKKRIFQPANDSWRQLQSDFATVYPALATKLSMRLSTRASSYAKVATTTTENEAPVRRNRPQVSNKEINA